MPRDRETVELFKNSPAPTRYRNGRKDKSEHPFDYRFSLRAERATAQRYCRVVERAAGRAATTHSSQAHLLTTCV